MTFVKTNIPRSNVNCLLANVIRNFFIKNVWKVVANAHAKICGMRRSAISIWRRRIVIWRRFLKIVRRPVENVQICAKIFGKRRLAKSIKRRRNVIWRRLPQIVRRLASCAQSLQQVRHFYMIMTVAMLITNLTKITN